MEKYRNYLKSLIPFVAEAYTHVYGEEFKDIINKRLNNAVIIPYYDIVGLHNYLEYIKRCKRREYSIRFLEEIGVDVKKYKKNNYTEPLNKEVEVILNNYIFSSYKEFGVNIDGVTQFKDIKQNDRMSLRDKIKTINYILGDEHEEINEENFELFINTDKYQQILKKINEIYIIYQKQLEEYRKWEEQLKLYDNFVQIEEKRISDILKKYKLLLTELICSKLSILVKNNLSDKSLEEKSKILIGLDDIGCSSFIEMFDDVEMDKLKSKNIELWKKDSIIWTQSKYLKKLGVVFPNEKILRCESEEDVKEYLEFISQDDIKQYIPSKEIINIVKSNREARYEDALREYFGTRNDFIAAKKEFSDNKENFDFIYRHIKSKSVCVTREVETRSDKEFFLIMFYTITSWANGQLFYNFVHECGHIIDQTFWGCGFERLHDLFDGAIKNPYDKKFRKYERFNEIINDVFATEVEEYWNNKGMYFIEPQEFVLLDKVNYNTSPLTRDLLKPLISKFKKQVIRAKIYSNHEELTRYIGKENFKELVDSINKVDHLTIMGLASKIDVSPEDEMVKEYYEQVERINKIYSNIDKYNENYINQLYSDPYNYSKPRR